MSDDLRAPSAKTESLKLEQGLRVQAESLRRFCERALQRVGVSEADAQIVADVLVEADLRGIDSHGVARLRRLYVHAIREGAIAARPREQVVMETPTTVVIDAGAGLGHPVSYRAMEKAIQKARDLGVGFATVRNSNHFGIAGYYAMLALEHDCIGIAMTNSSAVVTPTFARDAVLGTNPIAVAAPAGEEPPFVLDMATSTVPVGKLEVYDRLAKPLPLGWVVDATGVPMTDAGRALESVESRAGGGLLPLGGAGELLGGHKGYGLALWVEVFCAILAGAACSYQIYLTTLDRKPISAKLGHFFGAWRVDQFRPVAEFNAAMDDLQRRLKNTPKAEGQARVYVHGEKEFEEKDLRSREGIPLKRKVMADLQEMAKELGINYDL
jgi:L-2-hydroxycarboxylate dehydrogenase (NAD+)